MIKFDHLHIHSSDLGRTLSFYSKYFGARIVKEGISLGKRFTVMELGGIRLSIFHMPPRRDDLGPEDTPISHFAIEVKNIESLYDNLKKDGYQFARELTTNESGAKLAFVLAPDRVCIEIVERP